MAAKLEIVGFVANDPSQGTSQAGKAWMSLSVAHTPRMLNKNTNQWEDVRGRNGEDLTVWVRATFFDDLAKHLGSAIKKGDMVRLEGEPRMNAFLDKQGQPRGGIDLWGASLTVVPRAPKQGAGQAQSGFVGGSSGQGGFGAQEPAWSNPGQGLGVQEESPF